MATLKEIARIVGTSVPVVSKVLNNSKTTVRVQPKVRERIIQVARELGYRPHPLARGLAKGKTYVIGVLFTYPSPAYLSSLLSAQILAGIWDKARKEGYSLFLNASRRDKMGFFPPIEEVLGRVDGVIALGPVRMDDKEVEKWKALNIPIVMIGYHPKFKGVIVDYDNEGGAYLATKYLIERGHKRIGLIGIGLETSFMWERYKGYERALKEAGIGVEEDLIVKMEGFGEREGYRGALRLLNLKEPPSAIFVAVGEHIRGVCQAVREKEMERREKVVVMNFDKLPGDFSAGVPSLALNTSLYKLGLWAGGLLFKMMEGKEKRTIEKRLPIRRVIQIG